MTRPERLSRQFPPTRVSGGASSQHISSIAHLFFSEEETPHEGQGDLKEGKRLLVVGSGQGALAPNLAAGLAREILMVGQSPTEGARSGRDCSWRQVFLGEPSAVRFSAFSHLPAESFRPPRPEESVPWKHQAPFTGVGRVFAGAVPGEDFTAGREQGRFFVRHMDLPRERELGAMEATQATVGFTEVARDGAQALLWCLNAEEGPSLQETSRLGRLLRLTRPEELRVVMVARQRSQDHDRCSRMQRLVNFVSGEVPVVWHELGPERSERLALQADLARQLAPV